MTCNQTKQIGNGEWPLYRKTESGLCCYLITSNSNNEIAAIVANAQNEADYVKRSQFYDVPDNKIQVYLYFKAS